NGHVEYDLHVVDAGGTTWLIVDAASVDALHTYLDRTRFLADVAVTDVSDEYDVVWVPRREEHEDLPTWLVPAEYAGVGTTDSGEDRGGTAAKYVPGRPDRLIGAEVVFPRGERPTGPECGRSEEHTSELQSRENLVCRLLL